MVVEMSRAHRQRTKSFAGRFGSLAFAIASGMRDTGRLLQFRLSLTSIGVASVTVGPQLPHHGSMPGERIKLLLRGTWRAQIHWKAQTMTTQLWLLPLGVLIGAFGTLIGAGGGFILVPILLILYPSEATEQIASISLAVVFFNAFSGSLAYARMKRIDYKAGIIFSVATIPGAILGAVSTAYVPRRLFDLAFGVIMITAGIYLWFAHEGDGEAARFGRKDGPSDGKNTSRWVERLIVDGEGVEYRYRFDSWLGIFFSIFVGFVSSLLGVGGGFIHVPLLNRLLNFPIHIATATSHFVLAIMALTGTVVHIIQGSFVHGLRRTIILAIGVFIGAQAGARLSNVVGGKVILRGLAVALVFVGVRLILSEL